MYEGLDFILNPYLNLYWRCVTLDGLVLYRYFITIVNV